MVLKQNGGQQMGTKMGGAGNISVTSPTNAHAEGKWAVPQIEKSICGR